jgi:hypothetical protein
LQYLPKTIVDFLSQVVMPNVHQPIHNELRFLDLCEFRVLVGSNGG